MRFSAITAAALASLTIGAASAQEHKRSEFTLGYTSVSGVNEGGSYLIAVKSDWSISSAFGVQGNLAFRDTEGAISNAVIGLHGYYEFASGHRVGLFYNNENLVISSAPFEPTFESVGLEAMISLSPKARLELYFASGSVSGFPAPITGFTSYGMQAAYDLSPSFRARVHYDVDELEAALPVGTMSEMGIGIDYFVEGAGSGVPLILSAEATRNHTPFGGDTAESFSLKVTIPIGGETTSSGRQLFGDRNTGEIFATFGG